MKKLHISIKTELYDAFIFDMDGLLLDTEKSCWNCFKEVCTEYGYTPDFEIYRKCIGRSAVEGNKILKEGFGNYIPYEKANKKWNELYRSKINTEEIPLKRGIIRFLDYLKEKKMKIAVATSTDTELALKKLKSSGILKYFQTVTGSDRVKNSKPDPDIYLETAKMLNVKPEKCIAFEDSDNGVRSAHSAGMTVIQIPDLTEPVEDVRKLGHSIIQNFDLIELL